MPDSTDAIEMNTQITEGSHPEHRYQKPGSGWCGPALLHSLHFISGDKDTTQDQIAHTKMKDGNTLFDFENDWGTSHERMFEYLEKNWSEHGILTPASWEDIKALLDKGYFVIANVVGIDVEDNGEIDKGGHYVRIKSYDPNSNSVEVHDPSNGVRPDGKKGVYTIRADADPKDSKDSLENMYNFSDHFWDYANPEDEQNEVPTKRWIAFANPLSFKTSVAPVA